MDRKGCDSRRMEYSNLADRVVDDLGSIEDCERRLEIINDDKFLCNNAVLKYEIGRDMLLYLVSDQQKIKRNNDNDYEQTVTYWKDFTLRHCKMCKGHNSEHVEWLESKLTDR